MKLKKYFTTFDLDLLQHSLNVILYYIHIIGTIVNNLDLTWLLLIVTVTLL